MDSLVDRAYRAFLKSNAAGSSFPAAEPVERLSDVRTLDGLTYVVFRDERRTLAVYRLRNDGVLRRLSVWPLQLNRREAAEAA